MEFKKTCEYFRNIRLMLNMSQSHFACLLGISKIELQDIENGNTISKGTACSAYIEMNRIKESKYIYNLSNSEIIQLDLFIHNLKLYINCISIDGRQALKEARK